MKATLALSLVLILTVSSCGKLDKMSENATAASENSGRAADAASESREEIAYSRMMGRSGATSAQRREALEGVLSMKTFEMKVTEAAKYLAAFEYQLWTAQKYDSGKYLDALKTDAVNEFFRSLSELYADASIVDAEITPLRMNETQRDLDMNILSMAVALHKVHNVQELVTKDQRGQLQEAESMLSILRSSLERIHLVKNEELAFDQLKEHEKAVYNYRKESLRLLQGRIDMFLSMTLSKVSPIKDGTTRAAKLTYLDRSFQSRYAQLELGRQVEVNKYVREAAKAATFLDSIGEKVVIDKSVNALMLKMRFPNFASTNKSNEATHSQKNHQEFVKELGSIFKIQENRLRNK